MLTCCSRSLGIAVLVGAAMLGLPKSARACTPGTCTLFGEVTSFFVPSETVFEEGVLLLETVEDPWPLQSVESVFERMSVTVVDEMGFEVPGTLEAVPGVYLWRPDAPLVAGDLLSVSYSVTPQLESCADTLSGVAWVTVVDGAPPPLALPEIEFTTAYELRPDVSLSTLVCCDDAFPQTTCGDTYWGRGHCASLVGTGFALADVGVEGLDPALAMTTRLDYAVDGEVVLSLSGVDVVGGAVFSYARESAYEVTVRLVDLASGALLDGGSFLADGGRPNELGMQPIEVADSLEKACVGPAYVCDDNGVSWEEDACTPHGGGSGRGDTGRGDTGGGDETTGSDGAATTSVDDPTTSGPETDGTGSGSGAASELAPRGGCRFGGGAPFSLLAAFGFLAGGARTRSSADS